MGPSRHPDSETSAWPVEKVCLQTIALDDPATITRIADNFGRQSVVVSVDVKKNWRGEYKLYRSVDGKKIKQPWLEYLQNLVNAGAGEVIVNSVDLDGTMEGYDLELIEAVVKTVDVPVIASGGAGNYVHMLDAITKAGASAVAAASMFHFTEQTPASD